MKTSDGIVRFKIFSTLEKAIGFLRAWKCHRTLSQLPIALEKYGDYYFIAYRPREYFKV